PVDLDEQRPVAHRPEIGGAGDRALCDVLVVGHACGPDSDVVVVRRAALVLPRLDAPDLLRRELEAHTRTVAGTGMLAVCDEDGPQLLERVDEGGLMPIGEVDVSALEVADLRPREVRVLPRCGRRGLHECTRRACQIAGEVETGSRHDLLRSVRLLTVPCSSMREGSDTCTGGSAVGPAGETGER